jgi:hypothetical protein
MAASSDRTKTVTDRSTTIGARIRSLSNVICPELRSASAIKERRELRGAPFRRVPLAMEKMKRLTEWTYGFSVRRR